VGTFDVQQYQQALVSRLIKAHHDAETDPENPFVVYDVEDCLRGPLHDYFVFQTPADFQFDWLEQSKVFVRGLSNFQKNILRAYTRHGDELVNAYLRDPDGFQNQPRVQELLFSVMPNNFSLPFASHLAEDHISQDMNRSYLEDDFFDDVGDVRELGQRVQQSYITSVLLQNPVDWSNVRRYLDRYVEDFRDIFQRAPKPSAPLFVFRGVKTDYMNQVDTPVLMKGYTSTTYSVDVACNFAGSGRQLYEIMILPGTPCLAMDYVSEFEGIECEVLVDSHVFAVAEKNFEKKLLHPDIGYAEPLTPNIVLDGQNETFKSRLVVVHPPEQAGGFVASKVHHPTTFKKLKSRIRKPTQSRSKLRQKPTRHSMHPRADPTPMWGLPVSPAIQHRLRAALATYRPKRG
jgi:hypothetical protein